MRMRISGKVYGGYTRAKDGWIVTFLMPDGSTHVKHFASIVKEKRHIVPRVTIFDRTAKDLVVEWADEHEAKIISISTPDTILRDLQGTRERLEPNSNQKHPADVLQLPEPNMLGARGDLFVGGGRR